MEHSCTSGDTSQGQRSLHIAWVNERSAFAGGCERYIQSMAGHLSTLGCRSTLLFDPSLPLERDFATVFDGAFPLVDPALQLADLRPDVVFVHRLSDARLLRELVGQGAAVVRFFHDHRLFCPREHKYTAIGRRTCTRTIGAGCLGCLRGARRGPEGGIQFTSVRSLRKEQRLNMDLDACVVASSYMAKHLVDHGFSENRVHVLPLFPAESVSDARAAGLRREDDLLLFVGQLVMGKGVDVLLDAMSIARTNCRLVVAGSGRQEEIFRMRARQLGLADRVSFLGRASPAELDLLYRTAACVVVPSRTPETFGLVGVEALKRGTPVIGTTVGGIEEWLHPGTTGLAVPPGDAGALAAAMDRILTDPVLAESMGSAGAALCEERFRADRHADELLQLFRGLVR